MIFQLADLLKKFQLDVLQTFLPMANTLGMISGALSRVPCKCTGLRASDLKYDRTGPRLYFWMDQA